MNNSNFQCKPGRKPGALGGVVCPHLKGGEDVLAVQQRVHEFWVVSQAPHDDAVQDLQHDAQEVKVDLQLLAVAVALARRSRRTQPPVPAPTRLP